MACADCRELRAAFVRNIRSGAIRPAIATAATGAQRMAEYLAARRKPRPPPAAQRKR